MMRASLLILAVAGASQLASPSDYVAFSRSHIQQTTVNPAATHPLCPVTSTPWSAQLPDGGTMNGTTVSQPSCWLTHVNYCVPSSTGALPPLCDEHWSPTNPATVAAITALITTVVLPAWAAQHSDALAVPGVYPVPALVNVDWVGVDAAGQMIGWIRVPPYAAHAGAPPVVGPITGTPPAAALAAVRDLETAYVVPAIRAERGLQ